MRKKKPANVFNVLLWNFNTDSLEHYDVLPYFRERYKENQKKAKSKRASSIYKLVETLDDMRELVKKSSLYMFWARCEYEMILHGWPVQRNEYKLDVHEQVMMNIETISKLLFEEVSK